MLFEKFLRIIKPFLQSDITSDESRAALCELNPDKFYLENVRSMLGVSHQRAMDLCEAAVRQGVFSRRVEVMCPDGAVAASADTESQLPPTVHCWTHEHDHLEEVELPTTSLTRIVSYSLNDQQASGLYRQTA